MKKVILGLIFFMIFIVPIVSADIIVPWYLKDTYLFIPFLFVIIPEIIIFWLMSNKLFGVKVSFWKSVLIVFIANTISTAIGIAILQFGMVQTNSPLSFMLPALLLSIIFEFLVYLLFFLKINAKKWELLWISVVANITSYLSLFVSFN